MAEELNCNRPLPWSIANDLKELVSFHSQTTYVYMCTMYIYTYSTVQNIGFCNILKEVPYADAKAASILWNSNVVKYCYTLKG